LTFQFPPTILEFCAKNYFSYPFYNRTPLTVSLSPDGYRFNRAFALRCGQQPWRVPTQEVLGRGGGWQYPSAIVHDGTLYVLYSMGKEDICISSVPLTALA